MGADSWQAPPDFKATQKHEEWVIAYAGTKPIPSSVPMAGGFRLPIDPKVVVQIPSLAMQISTQEFFYKYESEHERYSSEAVARFHEDRCRFPPRCYESGSMLQKANGVMRQPSSSERLAIHCFPPRTLEALDGNGLAPAQREQKKNCLVGNGFHLASAMAFIFILLSAVQPAESSLARQYAEEAHAIDTRGSIFHMNVLKQTKGLLSPDDIADDIVLQFSPLIVDDLAVQFPGETLERMLFGCSLIGHGRSKDAQALLKKNQSGNRRRIEQQSWRPLAAKGTQATRRRAWATC